MPNDVDVYLKNPSTHPLRMRRLFLLYIEHHQIHCLSQHFWINIVSCNALLFNISNMPLHIFLEIQISHLKTYFYFYHGSVLLEIRHLHYDFLCSSISSPLTIRTRLFHKKLKQLYY